MTIEEAINSLKEDWFIALSEQLCVNEDKKERFIKAIKMSIDALETKKAWVSVKDRLPENDYEKHWKERKNYLVQLVNGSMRVTRFGYHEYNWWIDSHDAVLCAERYTEVTHWMPLPEPPSIEEQEENNNE